MANISEKIVNNESYKWWVLAIVMLGTFMAVLDLTVVNVGLPAIMAGFNIGIGSAEWVVTSYMITMTIMLPSAGWFADRFGNKRINIVGLVLFTLGSWLCARSSSEEFLIASRAIQGIGSGVLQALGLAIVTREFDGPKRGVALGLWAMASAASISFGPLFGGWLVDRYNWHLIFDVNVPFGLLAILLSVFIQREWHNPLRTRFDWPAFVAIVLFMPTTIYALARGNSPTNSLGWAAPEVIICFAVAAIAFVFFIFRELHTDQPLLRIRLLGDRNFGIAMAILSLFAVGMLGGAYLMPLYMQKGLGYTAFAAGSLFLPVGLIQGVLSAASGYVTRYIRPIVLVGLGVLILAFSFWFASYFTIHTSHRHIMQILYLRGLGMGLAFAPLNLFALRHISQHDMAAASGISNSIKQLFGSLGIALLTMILSRRMAHHSTYELVASPQSYVESTTDALFVVAVITFCALLPLLALFGRRRAKIPFSMVQKGGATRSLISED